VCDEALERRIGSDEEPPAPPRDEIDVRIALHNRWRRLHRTARAERRQSVKPGGGKPVHDAGGDPVPRWHEHGHKAVAESSSKLDPAVLQFGDDCFDRPMIPELPVALTHGGVVAMRVSVLRDRHDGRLLQAVDQASLEQRRNDGQCDGNVRGDRDFEQRGKRR
jgi:hypothetical protein